METYPGDTRPPLEPFLLKAWKMSTVDPRTRPHYCPKQARKTPMIPWHNGFGRCLACGKETR